MSKDKLQIGVYKIDTNHNSFNDCKSTIEKLSDMIQENDVSYNRQEIQNNIIADYKLILLYKMIPQDPKWKGFLSSIAKKGQSILKKKQSRSESFILLFAHNTTNNLYSTVGGMGYFAIQDVIEDDFGIDIISRLIKKEDKILKAISEKSVIGSILGSTKHFRKTYNLFENDSFGKIYQELTANLDTNLLTSYFGFSTNELKKDSVCVAKSSFRINKSITLDQLLKIVDGCEEVLIKLSPIAINNVVKIIKKRNPNLIQNLENELYNQLWIRYQDSTTNIDFDLCHKEYEYYLTASSYVVRKNTSEKNFFDDHEFDTLENIDTLFEKIKDLDKAAENIDQFKKLLSALQIYSYGEDENELTKGWLFNHIFGDISYEDSKYFLIDNNWYQIKADFLSELNNGCQEFIDNNAYSDLDKQWDYPAIKENGYNQLYIGDRDTIVLDKIIPRNIEPCDILKWDLHNLYLIHIKASFGNTMRDLCSQIFIAAKLIRMDKNASQEYIGDIYDQLNNKIGSDDSYFALVGKQTEAITKTDFINLFISKKLIFVLAVLDTANVERGIENIEQFNSNIAKFTLQDLVIGMRGIDVEFKIAQIHK